MYRDKRKYFVLATAAFACLLSACASTDELMTDTGSMAGREIAREEYLNVAALDSVGAESGQSNYKIYTLEKGVYTEAVMNQTLERTYINAKTVKVEVEEGQVRMGEYLISGTMIPVEEGDTIATIVTEVDKVTMEEAQLHLTRLKERYEQAYQKYLDDLEELRAEKDETGNENRLAVIDLKCEQRRLDWEKTKRDYEMQTEDAREKIADLQKSNNTTEIKAPVSGYVVFTNKYPTGTELKKGDYICHIMTADDFYMHTENYAHQFTYGMDLKFTSWGNEWEGKVVNGTSRALYGNMDTGETVFSVDVGEQLSELTLREFSNIVVEGNSVSIENVVLVPLDAVTETEDSYYVTVLNEDGSLLKTEFLPGGKNAEHYWVYDGLSEGMQIIYQ